jgi:hypothetical protein
MIINKIIKMNKLFILFFVGVFSLLLISSVSALPPDSDNNGCVTLGEISSYVNLWLQGNITLGNVSSGVLWWLGGCVPTVPPNVVSTFVVNHNSMNVTAIPISCINKVKTDLHIGFSHTSHGSQIPSGMNAMRTYNSLYSYSQTGSSGLHFEDYPGRNVEYDGFGTGYCYDLGVCDNGAQGILLPTRTYLNSARGQSINVIMWSWSSILDHNITFYLDKMQTLIIEYENGSAQHPGPVKFVFITGYADSQGPGEGSNLADYQNRLIRNFVNNQSANAFCKRHQCILYDFGDMEEYDPDNNYYLDRYVGDNLNYHNPSGNWGADYLSRHPIGMDADLTNIIANNYECAHSDSPHGAYFNCVQKSKAAWYMYARMVGWDGTSTDTCSD